MIVVHGGAGPRAPDLDDTTAAAEARRAAARAAVDRMNEGGDALAAVEAAVVVLEDHPRFNAGRGSVLCEDGTVEMSASIMCGRTLRAGAVACVRETRNPVSLARAVLERSPHVFLAGPSADGFVRRPRQERLWAARADEHDPLQSFGTVGAVALDARGDLAAATSTGGTLRQWPGRIGDSAVIGAGTYAANGSAAISCTGMGEAFIRTASAYSCAQHARTIGLEAAADEVVHEALPAVEGHGGLIALDREGRIAMPFNTDLMYRCWSDAGGELRVAIGPAAR